MNSLGVGIIGAGKHGSRYAKHAAEDVDGMHLAAVCRRNETAGRELAGRLGCDFESDATTLAKRPDVDLVVVVTVPALIEPIVEAATEAGKHLLIEKPVALDLETAARIAGRIEQTGVYCMAGHTLRFNSVVNALKEQVGSLGRLDSLMFSQRFPPQPQLGWLDDPALSGGGNILHTGVHCFDSLRYITGLEFDTVRCTASSVYTKRTEDRFAALGTLRNSEATVTVSCSRTTQSRNGLIEITGENGQLVGDHVLHRMYAIGPGGVEERPPAAPRHTVPEILRAVAGDLAAGRPAAVPYSDGVSAVAVASACYRSVRSGNAERVVMPQNRP
jgi:predicted dehydrogenase